MYRSHSKTRAAVLETKSPGTRFVFQLLSDVYTGGQSAGLSARVNTTLQYGA